MAAVDFLNETPNNPGIESEITTDVINETTPQGYAENSQGLTRDPNSDAVIQNFNDQFTPAAIGPQGQDALYPGLKHNINVGTQSGSIIGSQGIYVPGGNIAAVDPVLARRKAIDDAAKDRAKALTPFTYKDPTKLKDARFQENFNKLWNDTKTQKIEEAKALYGKDFGIVLKDQGTKEGREFIQTMANFEFIQEEMDQITDLIAGIEKGLASGELEYSPATLKIYNDYKSLIGSFEDGDVMAHRDIKDMHLKLEGALGIEEQLGKTGFLSNIMGEMKGSYRVTDDGEYFSSKTNKKVSYKEALGQVTKSLVKGPLARGIEIGAYTEEDVLEAINSKFKDEFTQTGSMSQKSKATRGAEREIVISDGSGVNKHTKEQPGIIKGFVYNQETGVRELNTDGTPQTFNLKSLADATMIIKGSPKDLTVTDGEGNISSTKFSGNTMSNIQIITPDGDKTLPGTTEVELYEMSKLPDGRVIQKIKYAMPVTVTTPEIGNTDSQKQDTFRIVDSYIVLKNANGQPSGMITEINAVALKTDEERKAYKANYEELDSWNGGSTPAPSPTPTSGTSR